MTTCRPMSLLVTFPGIARGRPPNNLILNIQCVAASGSCMLGKFNLRGTGILWVVDGEADDAGQPGCGSDEGEAQWTLVLDRQGQLACRVTRQQLNQSAKRLHIDQCPCFDIPGFRRQDNKTVRPAHAA